MGGKAVKVTTQGVLIIELRNGGSSRRGDRRRYVRCRVGGGKGRRSRKGLCLAGGSCLALREIRG